MGTLASGKARSHERVGYGVDTLAEPWVWVRAEWARGRVVFRTCESPPEAVGETPSAAALSSKEGLTRWVEAPFSSRSKALKVLPTLLDIQLPFALEDCVYTFLEADRARAARWLAVVARRADVEKRLSELRAGGIDPRLLDHEGLALWDRASAEAPATPPGGACAVAVLRGDRSTLVIGRGGSYLQSHVFRAGDAAQLNRYMRASLGADAGPVRWIVGGAGAEDGEAVQRWRREVEPLWPGSINVVDEPRAFLARALAARLVAPDGEGCNLRFGALTHPSVSAGREAALRRGGWVALAAGILLCIVGAAALGVAERRRGAANAAFASLAAEVAGPAVGAARGVHALAIARREAELEKARLRPFREALRPSLTHRVSELMERAAGLGVRIEVLSVRPDAVVVGGVSPEWQTAERLADLLRAAGWTPVLKRNDALDDGTIPFTLSAGRSP